MRILPARKDTKIGSTPHWVGSPSGRYGNKLREPRIKQYANRTIFRRPNLVLFGANAADEKPSLPNPGSPTDETDAMSTDFEQLIPRGSITKLYRIVTRLHSSIPYQISSTGYALPVWHYFFEITRRCNLRCKMCQYIEWLENVPIPEQRDGELSTQQWREVIDQTHPLSLITFTGGEVWVRKDFPELLERASSKRRTHFISNCVMLTEDKVKLCLDLAPKRFGMKGLNFIGVSIDGTDSTVHDAIRAQRGAFDRSTEGIRILKRLREESGKRCPLVHMNTMLMADNLDQLPHIPALAQELGITVVNLLTEWRAADNPDLGHVDPATFDNEMTRQPAIDAKKLGAALRDTLANARKLGIEIRMPRMRFQDIVDHYDGGYDLKHMDCRAIWSSLLVGAKGGVYPACFIQNLGNVRDNTLKEIWNNDIAQEFRRRRRESAFDVCRGCCEMEYSKKSLPGTAKPLTMDPGATDKATEGSTA